MRLITEIRCFISRALILKKTCQQKKGWCVRTTWEFRRSWQIRYTILVNWYVSQKHVVQSVFVWRSWRTCVYVCTWAFIADASNLGCVQRDSARMDQEVAVHIQRRQYRQVRSTCPIVSAGGKQKSHAMCTRVPPPSSFDVSIIFFAHAHLRMHSRSCKKIMRSWGKKSVWWRWLRVCSRGQRITGRCLSRLLLKRHGYLWMRWSIW